MELLKLGAGLLAVAVYAYGLFHWIYRGRLWPALVVILALYPLLLRLTLGTPWLFLRAAPLLGVGMFFHRYRGRTLHQIRLLWFTTLCVIVVQVYYLVLRI